MTQKSFRFALVGAAGYVAPRHMKAISATGNTLVAAFDPSDSVGVIDSHFPKAHFFVEFERFDRHLSKLHSQGEGVDYLSVCSPNYLHDAHVRFALRSGADAICEKPLVLNPWNLDGLAEVEASTGQKINTILQLRLHPAILALKAKIDAGPKDKIYDVDLTYITSRGNWYYTSWKGDVKKSGGIASNIGVHFYDMLGFVFGSLQRNVVHHHAVDCAAGYLEYKNARVRWFLSINRTDLPAHTPDGQTTYRSITVEGDEIEFSGGFTDLHTLSYQHVLNEGGFRLDQVRPSIEIVSVIRSQTPELGKGEQHPFLAGVLRNGKTRYHRGWPV